MHYMNAGLNMIWIFYIKDICQIWRHIRLIWHFQYITVCSKSLVYFILWLYCEICQDFLDIMNMKGTLLVLIYLDIILLYICMHNVNRFRDRFDRFLFQGTWEGIMVYYCLIKMHVLCKHVFLLSVKEVLTYFV